jgi:hypothetical protein
VVTTTETTTTETTKKTTGTTSSSTTTPSTTTTTITITTTKISTTTQITTLSSTTTSTSTTPTSIIKTNTSAENQARDYSMLFDSILVDPKIKVFQSENKSENHTVNEQKTYETSTTASFLNLTKSVVVNNATVESNYEKKSSTSYISTSNAPVTLSAEKVHYVYRDDKLLLDLSDNIDIVCKDTENVKH